MSSQPPTAGAASGIPSPAEAQRAKIDREIRQTREALGDTVEALAYKADVKARTKDKVNERTEALKETGQRLGKTATDTYREQPNVVYGYAAGGLALVMLMRGLRRRR